MFDNDFETIGYRYFNSGPIVETETGSYADPLADLSHQLITWNHGIGEVLNSLLNAGLSVQTFQEFDFSPYNCLKGMKEIEPDRFQVEKFGNKLPLVYALTAVKRL
jgi:hypothetical protein